MGRNGVNGEPYLVGGRVLFLVRPKNTYISLRF